MTAWISVKERMPDRYMEAVWVWNANLPDAPVIVEFVHFHNRPENSCFTHHAVGRLPSVTHWMPVDVPEPPKD